MNANATIKVGRYDNSLTFAWEGEDIAAIAIELLRDTDRRFCTYAKFPDRPGLRFTVGPYLLETLECNYISNVIFARRIFI